ncbi:MAG TPA: patatin-like phospholipase family protein, partial [Rubrivivax sp.]|nr:patatin-like phospholipase family protein [Rubrivivax sp.]
MTTWRRAFTALCLAASFGGCSTVHYTVNAPLTETRPDARYAIRNLASPNNSDSLIVMVAFSGGGYRAAALALAAMELLRDTPIVWDGQQRRLLDEVDFISSVSGGSLAAAWFALHREAFFDTFEAQVLALDLQSALTARILSPPGLWRQTSARYGRSDLLQEVLDERLFHGARFKDLPRQRPMVFINATDIRYGERFEFTQDQFDPLCSDLAPFPLSRAVAASMAVPLLFSPVTLWNHREACRVLAPNMPLESQAARSRYVHLADGGLADNTGLSGALEIIRARGGLVGSANAAGFSGVRKRVFIVVNAQVKPDQVDDESADTPGLLRQVLSVVDVPIDRHAQASLRALENATRQWSRELQAMTQPSSRGALLRDTGFHVVELSLMNAPAGADKDRLKQIPTALRVGPDDVAALRRFVRQTVQTDPQWQRLLQALQPPAPISAPTT